MPYGKSVLGDDTWYLAYANIHSPQMLTALGGSMRLRVYPQGVVPNDDGQGAVIDILLDPVEMRKLGESTDPGIKKHVANFDDFVFTVREE